MTYDMGLAGAARLEEFLGMLGSHLRDKRKRASFAMYAFGILGEGDRKSVEPIAARAVGGAPTAAKNAHNKLLHFVGRAKWDDHTIRQAAARYALDALSEQEKITTWIITIQAS